MDAAELCRVLRDAGLSRYRAQAYTALRQFDTASATELADESGVPAARIDDVLRDLEEKGYVETDDGDTLRARASEPDTILSELRRRSEELSEAADDVETRWESPGLEHHRIDIVTRFDTVFEHAREAIAGGETDTGGGDAGERRRASRVVGDRPRRGDSESLDPHGGRQRRGPDGARGGRDRGPSPDASDALRRHRGPNRHGIRRTRRDSSRWGRRVTGSERPVPVRVHGGDGSLSGSKRYFNIVRGETKRVSELVVARVTHE